MTLHPSIPRTPFPAPGPRLRDAIEQGQQAGRGLLLVLTPPDHGWLFAAHASFFGLPSINLSIELARRLLDVPLSERAAQASWQLPHIFPDSEHAVAVGHLGLLFLPELEIDPIRALTHLARSRLIVAEFNGAHHDGLLSYAEHGHPEHQAWHHPDCTVVHLHE